MRRNAARSPALVALLAASALACDGRARATIEPEGFLPGRDVELYYSVRGQGTDTVIVLHGGPGGDHANVAPDLEPLEAGLVLIHYDQRGGGRSTPVVDAQFLTAADHVADLEAVRRFFGLERVRLLGHSWGAGLAALYAIEHPERVDRMLLVAAIPPAFTPYMVQFRENVIARMDPDSLAWRELLVAHWQDQPEPTAACERFWTLTMRVYTAGPVTPRGRMCDAPPATLRNFFVVSSNTLESLGDWDLRPSLRELRVSTLIVHGSEDPIPVDATRAWADALPLGELLVVDGAGHFVHAERPDLFGPAALGFLRGR